MADQDNSQPTQTSAPAETPPVPPVPTETTQPSSQPGPQPPLEPMIEVPPPPSQPSPTSSSLTSTQSAGGGAKNFILGLLFGLIVAVLAGVGVYFWQSDLNKAEIETANAKVTACEEEITKSLDAANVWKDQFVRLSQTVNSAEWIAEHCGEVTEGEETEEVIDETEETVSPTPGVLTE